MRWNENSKTMTKIQIQWFIILVRLACVHIQGSAQGSSVNVIELVTELIREPPVINIIQRSSDPLHRWSEAQHIHVRSLHTEIRAEIPQVFHKRSPFE